MARKTGMRKGLTSYGDEGFSLFPRKAFIKALAIPATRWTGRSSTPTTASCSSCSRNTHASIAYAHCES